MLLYRFLKPLAVFIFKFFFLIRIGGRENIPVKGGVIITSNHISFLDPVVLGVASPRILHFMAKDELFKMQTFSWLITRLGAFQLKKGRPDKTAVKKAVQLLKKGEALVIFPEGARSKDGNIQKGQTGCVWIARASNVLIVPARIYGSDFALPVDSKMIRPYPLKVVFGKALDVKDYPDLSLEDLTEILMQKIREL